MVNVSGVLAGALAALLRTARRTEACGGWRQRSAAPSAFQPWKRRLILCTDASRQQRCRSSGGSAQRVGVGVEVARRSSLRLIVSFLRETNQSAFMERRRCTTAVGNVSRVKDARRQARSRGATLCSARRLRGDAESLANYFDLCGNRKPLQMSPSGSPFQPAPRQRLKTHDVEEQLLITVCRRVAFRADCVKTLFCETPRR